MEISQDLIERVCNGDEQAYSELFQLTWDSAVRTCWLILRNQHDAEEAAQESFLKLYIQRQRIRDVGAFQGWFYRILVNTALDRVRKRKSVLDIDSVQLTGRYEPMHNADRRMMIDEAMRKLTYDERVAVVLVHFNGLKELEAANAVGWTLGKLKYRLNRARRVLSNVIGQDDQDPSVRIGRGIQR
ncbi:RNA polymerase sigma-70 factor, ECF subfamily [Alicyclobacillus hesperidum]|uniref:RNA polymerase sigma-70 factor, ECF subfamily n=1 Tax=Alicyclobacillus hesperidum TaxID=89784 RepID=A0A1H2YHA7_9BACL|nr:RNA polymerase sigma factor [Alicyclobacillus hesperidum]SDX04188.1 RNA polymerase sigma-70 factor, ECF subfamily [Alicyclobacillus hesperidum]